MQCSRSNDLQSKDTSALTDDKVDTYQEFERVLREYESRRQQTKRINRMWRQPPLQPNKFTMDNHRYPVPMETPTAMFTANRYGQRLYRFCFGK